MKHGSNLSDNFPQSRVSFQCKSTGTLLLQSDQRIGLDLPLKALVRGSAKGETVVDVQDPIDLAAHYRVTDLEVVAKMQQVVHRIVQEATGEAL